MNTKNQLVRREKKVNKQKSFSSLEKENKKEREGKVLKSAQHLNEK